MALQLAPTRGLLPLLFEPDGPSRSSRISYGWRRRPGSFEIVRHHTEDEFGARVQYAIVLYAVRGMHRDELAEWLGIGIRSTADVLNGRTWACYSRPVIRALASLGMDASRRGERHDGGRRYREIQVASNRVMRQALAALSDRPMSVEQRGHLISDLRLLSITEADLS